METTIQGLGFRVLWFMETNISRNFLFDSTPTGNLFTLNPDDPKPSQLQSYSRDAEVLYDPATEAIAFADFSWPGGV